jgi:hypothetical protein
MTVPDLNTMTAAQRAAQLNEDAAKQQMALQLHQERFAVLQMVATYHEGLSIEELLAEARTVLAYIDNPEG